LPRQTVVDNGRLDIAFDSFSSIKDLFCPRVGLENHTSGHEFRDVIWADGVFSWIDKGWNLSTKYMPEALVSRTKASNPSLGIYLEANVGGSPRPVCLREEAHNKQSQGCGPKDQSLLQSRLSHIRRCHRRHRDVRFHHQRHHPIQTPELLPSSTASQKRANGHTSTLRAPRSCRRCLAPGRTPKMVYWVTSP